MKKILVDMSATLIHHGHIRLLKKANKDPIYELECIIGGNVKGDINKNATQD